MNQTNLNTELLAGESRTRKHVPVAVFAVIFIHIILFLLLLIAAGCRARARAQQAEGDAQVAQTVEQPAAIPAVQPEIPVAEEPVIATEPPLETATPLPVAQAGPKPAESANEPLAGGVKMYVVQPGDSLWLIARRHNTTVSALKALNNLKSDRLQTGQKLKVDSSTSLRAQKT